MNPPCCDSEAYSYISLYDYMAIWVLNRTMTHSPKLDTMLMVEKQIVDLIKKADYPTRTELWKSLPKGMEYQTFKQILDYLEASNKIVYKEEKIVWVAADNPKLKQLLD